jgi:hypothetical protein
LAGEIVLVDQIEPLIKAIRGQNVILDSGLAKLYGVAANRLNEQVRRNRGRFPDDFLFRLTVKEAAALKSQNATLKPGRGTHRKYLPYAFTEHPFRVSPRCGRSLTEPPARPQVSPTRRRLKPVLQHCRESTSVARS